MDGIHDLGGRHGFGSIDVHEPEKPFHEPWEARVFGMVRSISRPADWSIDWFRHCRELIEPIDYLSRPYYDQWLQTYAAMMVNSGVATVAELASGKAMTAAPDLPRPLAPSAVEAAKRAVMRFDREAPAGEFAVGDVVTTASHGVPGHTRLPAYVRGHRGRIEASHGAHVLPDANARGDKRAEPLYTVAFDAAELFTEATGRRDRVFLDLWESYLEHG